jgi:hypothetical protein
LKSREEAKIAKEFKAPVSLCQNNQWDRDSIGGHVVAMTIDEFNQLDDPALDAPESPDPADASDDPGAPALRARPALVEQFVGIIRSSPGSGSGGDYADARYFIDRAMPRTSLASSDVLAADKDSLPGVKECITATNLAELVDGTHQLSDGTLVQVFSLYVRGRNGAKLHVFNQPPRGGVVVQITGNASGNGEYNGRILSGSSNASPSSALSMPAGLSIPGSDDALVLNLEEDGASGHRIASGTYAVGVVRGITNESPPRKIVFIRGGVGRTDSPTALGGTSEGSESADSSNWTRLGATPVVVYVVTRTVYNESGDKTLYSFVRPLTFDARGLLVSAGAETRVTVDVTEACP